MVCHGVGIELGAQGVDDEKPYICDQKVGDGVCVWDSIRYKTPAYSTKKKMGQKPHIFFGHELCGHQPMPTLSHSFCQH